jgi:hypothetical protein
MKKATIWAIFGRPDTSILSGSGEILSSTVMLPPKEEALKADGNPASN